MPADKKLHILMLEDNPADADLNAEQLSDAGLSFEYHRVENEQDYVKELAEFKPDIILADYRLPQFDGLAALRLVRERFPFIPFILVTGVLEEEAAAELFKAGATDYIRKGKAARLATAVKKALELKEAQEKKARAEEELRKSYQELEHRVAERTKALAETSEALRVSEERFRIALKNAPITVATLDRELRYMWVYNTRHGFKPEHVIGKRADELIPPGEAAETTALQEEVLKSGAGARREVRGKTNGVEWVYDATAEPIRNERGEITGITWVAIDITERKKAEEAVRIREVQLNAFFENATGILHLLDDSLCYINTDRVFPTFFGLSREAIRGRCMSELVPRVAEQFGGILRHVIETGEPRQNFETQDLLPTRTGEPIYARASLFRVPLGGGKWGVGIIGIDITDIKKAEDTLRRNEYEMRTLVDNSPDLIFRMNRRMQYVYANPAYERLTGILRDQFIGRTNRELGMTPRLIEFWQAAAQRVMESGQEYSVEFDITSFFGKRYFFARIIPEFDKSGLVETVLVIARDITERKKAEDRIRYVSFHDEVTGLFNRAFFEEEIRRVDTERDLPVSIIMGDVNNLKLFNDVFGHDEGDRLLKAIADIFRKACRQSDIIARWGGDEFAVILPGTDFSTADGVCVRIKQVARESTGTVIQPGVALGVATKEEKDTNIYAIVRQAEERMYNNKLEESRENEENVFASLYSRVRERNKELDEHIARSGALADAFGTALELSENQRDDLRLLIRLHDIGDAVIPQEILTKPGPLDQQEWETVKKHPEAGLRIVKTFVDTARISDEVFSHGERWDGTGYPRGLKGKEIPCLARVFLVLDAFDVMTHPRPYARTFSREEAAEELRRNAGRQFDPELVERFIVEVLSRQEVRV